MKMMKLQRIAAIFAMAALVVTSMISVAGAAPVADAVRTTEITGTVPGGQFAEIWLDLEVVEPGTVTVLTTWESGNLDGVGFHILDDNGVAAVAGGGKARDNNIASGNPVESFRGTPGQQEASFRATAPVYKLIIFNESANDAIFDMTATNAYIVGENENVSDPNASMMSDEGDETAADTAAADEAVTDTADDAATETTTATTPTTTTEEEVVVEEPVATVETVEDEVATTEVAATGTPGVVTADTLEGELNEKDAQHFLSLKPEQKDGLVTLTISYEPSDSKELARRLNFWVLDPEGFNKFLSGDSLSSVALAAGSSTVDTAANERAASFKTVGFTDYTVIAYNTSNVPGAYTLVAEDALLTDDSGQTLTAQEATVVEETPVAETTDETVADDGTSTAAAAPATEATGIDGEPGGTYTIKSGDSMSAIARDVYGDIQLYDEICAYNNMDNCDVVEIGDVIKLPTQAELDSGATAPATSTTSTKTTTPATTTPTTTTSATKPATATDVTTTTKTIASTPSVTTTTDVTDTAGVTSTASVTGTAGVTGTTSAAAATVVDALAADGRFKTLIAALDAADLIDSLGDDTVTVFAPTDAAFDALPAGALDQLVAQLQTNANGQLMQILLYHVSSGELASVNFEDGVEIQTLQGNTAKIAVDDDGNVTINGAAITGNDIVADNGVIHAIEAVILPPVE